MDRLANELKDRYRKLQAKLVKNNLDAYVITDAEDIWYFSNIEYSPEQRPFIFIAYPDKQPLFIVPKLEESHVDVPYFSYDLVTYFDVTAKSGDNWYDILRLYISEENHVGIEANAPLFIFSKIKTNWLILNDVKNSRMIKSEYEIEKIHEVAKIVSSVVKTTLERVKYGTTVIETFQIPYKYHMKELSKYKGINMRTQNAVWPATYSYMPHSIPDATAKIENGANVNIAIFKLDGYAAECERTFFTVTPSEAEKKYFNMMIHAREIMLSMLKPGTVVSSIEEKIMAYFDSQGVADKVLHRPGHGLGLNNHEEPTISLGNNTQLTENMVISVEPGLYFKELGGFRHSDTVLITSDGYQLLTDAPSDLDSLILI